MKTHEKWKFYSFTPPKYGWVLTPKNEGFPWVPMVEGNFCRNPREAGFCRVFQYEWMEKKDQSPIGLNIWFGEMMSCTYKVGPGQQL